MLPPNVREALAILLMDIEVNGSGWGSWPRYGKLGEGRYHGHLKQGHPINAAIWEEREEGVR